MSLKIGLHSLVLNQLVNQQAGGPMQFKGHLNKPSKVMISNGTTTVPATVDANNVFQGFVDVVPGSNTVTIVATDYSGNNNTSTNRYQVVLSGDESKTCQWDANGCLTEIRTPQLLKQFEWDARNLLVKRTVTDLINPTNPVKTTEIVRDGLGRFVRITEKEGTAVVSDIQLVWDGFKIVEARDANSANVLIRFFDLGMEIVSGPNAGIYFYTFDHLGSIREVIRATTGQVVVRNEYDAWGQLARIMGTLPLSFAFQGMYDLGDNIYLTLYRPYFAELAKWGSPDPLGEQADLNLTRFVQNNPVNGADPLGLVTFFVHGTFSSGGGAFPSDFVQHVSAYYNDPNVRFTEWSGENNDVARIAASRDLVQQIKEYREKHPGEPIRVVAHSHGGNAALLASKCAQIDDLVTLGTPIMPDYQPGKGVKKWENVYSTGDRVQTIPLGATRTSPSANNIKVNKKYGHFDLHTNPAWDEAFPR